MQSPSILILLPAFLFSLVGCNKLENSLDVETIHSSEPTKAPVAPLIAEASGIADSRTFPGHLWVHEDSGNPTQLYLLKHDGTVSKTVSINGVRNRDWEDMALFEGQIYLADIGDNGKSATEYMIYHFPEPTPSITTVEAVSTIRFRYADGAHDAEAFLIDPKTRNILLLTKSDTLSQIYKINYPYSSTTVNVAQLVGKLPYSYVVSAALSPNGKEAIVKTYAAIYHYSQTANKTLEEYLLQDFKKLPYIIESQGEAVTFSAADSGYFTLSEKGLASVVNLYFYKKK